MNKLKDAILGTMYEMEADYIYGISSRQHIDANKWYKDNIVSEHKTFATIFVNNTWKKFKKVLHNIKEDVVLVGNVIGYNKEYPFNVIEYYPIKHNCVVWFQKHRPIIDEMCEKIATYYKDKLILFCA
jgi:hypothetical protein